MNVQIAQDEMYEWLQQDDQAKVALFDATNTTKWRREMLVRRSKAEKNTMLVFIESICDDPDILSQVTACDSPLLARFVIRDLRLVIVSGNNLWTRLCATRFVLR